MQQDAVLVERARRVATILFNPPPVNAASIALLEPLHRVQDSVRPKPIGAAIPTFVTCD